MLDKQRLGVEDKAVSLPRAPGPPMSCPKCGATVRVMNTPGYAAKCPLCGTPLVESPAKA